MSKSALILFIGLSMVSVFSFAQDKSKNVEMTKMRISMYQMKRTMKEISETKDQKKKSELMEQHMKDMKDHMDMMSSMMDNRGSRAIGSEGRVPRRGMDMMKNPEERREMHGMMKEMMEQMQGHHETCMQEMNKDTSN